MVLDAGDCQMGMQVDDTPYSCNQAGSQLHCSVSRIDGGSEDLMTLLPSDDDALCEH